MIITSQMQQNIGGSVSLKLQLQPNLTRLTNINSTKKSNVYKTN